MTATVAPNEVPYGSVAEPILDAAGEGTRWYATADPGRYSSEDRMLSDKMPTLVKGAGYCREGGNAPLTDDRDIFRRSMRAEVAFRKSMQASKTDPMSVLKGISPEFGPQLRAAAAAASPINQQIQQVFAQLNSQLSDALGKSITLTAPLTTGFVPYDLVAP